MALVLPLTIKLGPTAGLIMLAGIYYGSMYGGSTTSILVNVPGEAASVVTTIDGYRLGAQGPRRRRAGHRRDRVVRGRHLQRGALQLAAPRRRRRRWPSARRVLRVRAARRRPAWPTSPAARARSRWPWS
jgi:hypothetical protein